MQNTEKLIFKEGDLELDILYSPSEKTVWLSINQIAELYEKDRTSISRCLKTIQEKYKNENAHLSPNNVHFLHINNSKRPSKLFNLDTVLEVGNLLKSNNGISLKTFIDQHIQNEVLDDNQTQIIIFDDGFHKHELNFSIKEETVWANQAKIADIFETTQQNVSLHINNILEDKELDDSVHKDYLYTALDGKQYLVTFYNLDMILAVGYRVKTSKAISFRRWASGVIKNHLIKLYESKGANCIICRNEILELQKDVTQLKLEAKNEIVYYKGEQLRGFIEVKRFIETAKQEVILVDNYLGHGYDEVLSKLNVKKTIITNVKNKKIETCDNYTVIKINDNHDRYVLVDNVCYEFSNSLEKLGETISSSRKITDLFLINAIKNYHTND